MKVKSTPSLEFDKILNIDDTGSAKSINITTDGFTADEADAYIATIEEQFGDLDNFEINGETLKADEVDIITNVVPTGDKSTPFQVEVVIKPKNPDANGSMALRGLMPQGCSASRGPSSRGTSSRSSIDMKGAQRCSTSLDPTRYCWSC